MHVICLVDSVHLVMQIAPYPFGTSSLPVPAPLPQLFSCCLQDPEPTWELAATCLSTLLTLDDLDACVFCEVSWLILRFLSDVLASLIPIPGIREKDCGPAELAG